MSDKKTNGPQLINTLVWAALMIATSLVMADAEVQQKMTILLLQVSAWVATTLPLRNRNLNNWCQTPLACMGKWFGRQR